jgi:PmbA protein
MSGVVPELVALAEMTAGLAARAGAEAEVLVRDGVDLTVKTFNGEVELVKEARHRSLGLRVFRERRAAVTHTSDLRSDALRAFVDDTLALAAYCEASPLNRLPAAADMAWEPVELDLWDEESRALDADRFVVLGRAGAAAAHAVDARVGAVETTGARALSSVAFANTHGFARGYASTHQSLSITPYCQDDAGERYGGYAWTASRFVHELRDPESVGREAARRTLAKMGARPLSTRRAAVIFDAEAGRLLMADLFNAANGSAFQRQRSYLLGREGGPCASSLVTIVDDPLIPRGAGSRPFDGDGLASRRNDVVRAGRLCSVLCDTYTARCLGRSSTASAGRRVGTTPGPTMSNFVMQAGRSSPAEILRDTAAGLLVTGLTGLGFNPVTGDFSRGASGFWIERGEIAFPVRAVTISSTLDDIWQGVDAVGDDVDLSTSVACPTFRTREMTVAGS